MDTTKYYLLEISGLPEKYFQKPYIETVASTIDRAEAVLVKIAEIGEGKIKLEGNITIRENVADARGKYTHSDGYSWDISIRLWGHIKIRTV